MDVTGELLKVAAILTASSIKVVEQNGAMVVNGPYSDMSKILPQLKSRGFKYNPTDHSWSIPLSKLTPIKRKNLEDFLPISKPAESEEDKKKEFLELLEKKNDGQRLAEVFLREINKLKLFRATMTSHSIVIRGKTYDIKDAFFKAGAKWNSSEKAYVLDYMNIQEKSLKQLQSEIEGYESKQLDLLAKNIDYSKKHLVNNDWVIISVKIDLSNLVIKTTREHKDLINAFRGAARWVSPSWIVDLTRVTVRDLENFKIDVENELKRLHSERLKPAMRADYIISVGSGFGGKPFHEETVIRNTKAAIAKGEPEWLYVLRAEKRYFSEDGLSFGVGDDRGYIYTAYCREATVEEYNPVNDDRQHRIQVSELVRRFSELAKKIKEKGTRPEKANPRGRKYPVSLSYPRGSEEWFVVDGGELWLVKSNGLDGDDWSRNNMPGAIAWMTKDNALKAEFDVLMERSTSFLDS